MAKIAAPAADVVKYANALGLTPVGRQHLAPLAPVAASSRGCSAVILYDQYAARISEAKSGADLSGQPAQAIHPHVASLMRATRWRDGSLHSSGMTFLESSSRFCFLFEHDLFRERRHE